MQQFQFPRGATGLDSLIRVERDVPTPQSGQVLVKMHAASLNYRDLLVADASYPGGRAADLVPLSDGAGEIVDVGAGVDPKLIGVRVAGTFFQRWIGGPMTKQVMASALGGAIDGVLSEYVVLDHDGIVRLPDHMSYAEGASLPCAAVTAWHALFETAEPLKPGQTLLLLGTGGVSVFALQMAKAAGARVIITSSSDAKLAQARSALGADETINYRTLPDWQDEALRLTGGRGVDRVVEVGGAGTLQRSLHATRIGGRIALVGVLSGRGEAKIDPTPLLRNSQHVDGIYVGSRTMFEAMNSALSSHRIRPVIDRVFAFSEAREAYRHLQAAGHFGKVAISMSGVRP